MVREIEAKTDGRLKVAVYYGGLGYKGPDSLSILRDGLVDMGDYPTSVIGYEIPWCGITGLPYLIGTTDDVGKVCKAIDPMLEELSQEYNTILLANFPLPSSSWVALYTNKAINTLDDFKGMKIRQYSKEWASLYEKAGASSVYTDIGEVYMALKQGTIDAIATGPGVLESMKLYEVTKYMYFTWPCDQQCCFGASKTSFDKLPKDLQQVVIDCGKEFVERAYEWMATPTGEAKWVAETKARAEEYGMEVGTLPPDVDKALIRYAEEVLTEWKEKAGPDGEKVISLIRKELSKD